MAAERYLQVVTPEDLMRDTAEKVATNLPETKRKRFLDTMTKRFDFETINEVMIRSMVNRFTVREIDALANFYGSPEGKSVMKKFGLSMADVAPTIQAETTKALAKIRAGTPMNLRRSGAARCTSSLIGMFGKSASQRSGVISVKSEPKRIFCFGRH